MSFICFLTVFTLLCSSQATIPSNYILQVIPHCGSDSSGNATIDITTDLEALPSAECANGVIVDFDTVNGVNFELPVSYPGGGSNDCVFNKREGTEVYAIKVVIPYGEPGQFVHLEEEEFTISCVFDPKANDESSESDIHEGLIAPLELQNLQGTTGASVFTLELADVRGVDIWGRQVWRSRKVMLRATTDGADGEVGLRPVGCDAIGGSGARYAILRAGCGDGIIFKKNAGFTTNGLETRSPYFEAFGIERDLMLSFECNFTACDVNCDGSSCVNTPIRRSVRDRQALSDAAEDIIKKTLRTKPVFLGPRPIVPPAVAHSPHIAVDRSARDILTMNPLYWTAMLGFGLIVLTSLAVSVTACTGPRRAKVGQWNKA